MAESEEVNIDSQMDITQKSDREVEDNSQIIEKITSAYSANKDMLNMMHTMFSHLEEKLIANQEKISNSLEGKLRENQEKMNSLEEKLLENQEKMSNSLEVKFMESQEKIEEAMKCLEERINDKIKEQKVEFNIEIQEVENRKIGRASCRERV